MDAIYDVVIIGGGPAGNTAALYGARAEMRTLVLEKPGATGALATTEHIANYPGVPGPLTGSALVATMRQQAESFGATYRAGVVISVDLGSDPFCVFTGDGECYQTRGLIVATGALERKGKIPGEEELLGRGVSTCATCDAPFYRGKTVIVAGNDDSAGEECLAIARFAAASLLMTPTEQPRLSPPLLAELASHPAVTINAGWRLREILGDDHVRAARFQTLRTEELVPADGVFVLLNGAKPSTGFLQGQLPLDADGAIITHPDHSTAIPRVYAIGDVTAGHIKQAVVAAAEGCIAALALEKELRGRQKMALDYH